MTTTLAWRTTGRRRRSVGAALALIAVLGGCSMSTGSAGYLSRASESVSVSVALNGSPTLGVVVLRVGDLPVTASLADTAASRRLAQMLPATLELDDAWGQAKAGRLPHPLPTEAAARVLKPTVGGVYYWPGTQTLAVYYDDLGQSVPPPGLVPLGVVDTGLDTLADASQVTVRIDRAP